MPPKGPKCLFSLHLRATRTAGLVAVEMMTIPVIQIREKDQKRPSFSTFLRPSWLFSDALKGGRKTKARGRGPVLSYSFRDF